METLNKLTQYKNLTQKESQQLLEKIMTGEVTQAQTAAILTALKMKGETVAEILGFIKTMRAQMVKVKTTNAMDVCGTGGDGKNTFNISTAVSFIVSSAGVKVAKHGNRAASSQSGSADVLEALGIKTTLTPEINKKILETIGIGFFFAPLYHPGMKQVAPARQELKIPTIFNILGPFTNPAEVKKQLIGIASKSSFTKLAEVAKKLNYEHLILVSSQDGLDEVSIFAPTNIIEIEKQHTKQYQFNPQKYGFKYDQTSKITGGNAAQNAQIIIDVFNGEKGAKRDIVLVNSAFAFLAADKVATIKEGINLATEMINSGKAKQQVSKLSKETMKYV